MPRKPKIKVLRQTETKGNNFRVMITLVNTDHGPIFRVCGKRLIRCEKHPEKKREITKWGVDFTVETFYALFTTMNEQFVRDTSMLQLLDKEISKMSKLHVGMFTDFKEIDRKLSAEKKYNQMLLNVRKKKK